MKPHSVKHQRKAVTCCITFMYHICRKGRCETTVEVLLKTVSPGQIFVAPKKGLQGDNWRRILWNIFRHTPDINIWIFRVISVHFMIYNSRLLWCLLDVCVQIYVRYFSEIVFPQLNLHTHTLSLFLSLSLHTENYHPTAKGKQFSSVDFISFLMVL